MVFKFESVLNLNLKLNSYRGVKLMMICSLETKYSKYEFLEEKLEDLQEYNLPPLLKNCWKDKFL